MKSETLATIHKHNLATQPQNKYIAAKELSNMLSITHTHATTLINRMLSKIAAGLDPLADNRGGKRAGAGRKLTPKS